MIHIYSGDGKGKTTAAVGLAIRAAGAGLKIHFCQFLKNGSSSEIAVLRQINSITVHYCDVCDKFSFQMNDKEKALVKNSHDKMLLEIEQLIVSKQTDMIIMDEIFSAYNTGLADRELALRIVHICSEKNCAELVLTGRSPQEEFIKHADYHSIIKAACHPYTIGIKARKGIEF